jgi:hypothetical protein
MEQDNIEGDEEKNKGQQATLANKKKTKTVQYG